MVEIQKTIFGGINIYNLIYSAFFLNFQVHMFLSYFSQVGMFLNGDNSI